MTAGYCDGQDWYTDLDKALKVSVAEDKPVFLVFSGSDWCAPCIRFKKEILDTDDFMEFAKQSLVLLYIDFPRLKKNRLAPETTEKNANIAEKYNPSGAFPKVLLLGSGGEVLSELEHKPSDVSQYTGYLSKVLEEIK